MIHAHPTFAATLTALAALCVAGSADAQQGEYRTTGTSCNPGADFCLTQNDPVPGFSPTSLPNEYAHSVITTNAVTVLGFSIYTQSNTGVAETVQAALYLENPASPGQPDVNPVASGQVTVGAAPGWAAAWLDREVAIGASTLFFVSADTNSVSPPDAGAAGTTPAGPSFWRRPPFGGTAWTQTGIIQSPIWRIHCAGAADLPRLSATGVPSISTPMSVELSGAPAGTRACLGFGASNTAWGALALPFDGTALGATCCWANISCDVTVDVMVSAGGKAAHKVQVPNQPALLGGEFYNQWFILAPRANPLGLLTTNYGAGKIGT